jgi:hypothetical protein
MPAKKAISCSLPVGKAPHTGDAKNPVRPQLTARLHSLAASFDLQDHLANARDAQAASIAEAMNLPPSDVLMSVMAVEGVVLATLASHPARLKTSTFIDQLYAIALAPLSSVHFSAGSGDPGKAPR